MVCRPLSTPGRCSCKVGGSVASSCSSRLAAAALAAVHSRGLGEQRWSTLVVDICTPFVLRAAWKTLAERVAAAAEQLVSAHSEVQETQRKLRLHLATLLRPAPAQHGQRDADMEQQQQEEPEQEEEGGLGQLPSPSQQPQQQQQRLQHPKTRAAAGAQLEAPQEPRQEGQRQQGTQQPGGSGPPREPSEAGEQELLEEGGQGGSPVGEREQPQLAAVGKQEEEEEVGGELEAAEADWLYQELGPQQRELGEALARWREVATALEVRWAGS